MRSEYMVESDDRMLLQVFLHVDRKGDPFVEEVSMVDGKLYCTCSTKNCKHLMSVASNYPLYVALPQNHTPAERRDFVIRNRKTLV